MTSETILYAAAIFFIGFAVGLHFRRARCLITSAWRKYRMGICFRYLPGPREWRGGTLSNFCLRCGHPGGYHRFHC